MLLSTKENLMKKKVINAGLCSFCSVNVEDTNHALLSCLSIKDKWIEQFPFMYDMLNFKIMDVALKIMDNNKAEVLGGFFQHCMVFLVQA